VNRAQRRALGAPPEANITLEMAPMTMGAVHLDAQECRDIEAWATEFVESTGTAIPLDPMKYEVFRLRGLNMSLFRVRDTVQ
jgi:hypothetical protein